MTQHDTWVKFKPDNPYEPILHLFADGMVPMRDPFPMERAAFNTVSLWIIDLERLSGAQVNALAHLIADFCETTSEAVAAEAIERGGFAVNTQWIEAMWCGPEGHQRTLELTNFLATAPNPPSAEAFFEFVEDQRRRWIDGNSEPPPFPTRIEDVDPRLRTPELEFALKREQINKQLAGYSVLDVLTGRAMVDILNSQDPEHRYEVVGLEEFLED